MEKELQNYSEAVEKVIENETENNFTISKVVITQTIKLPESDNSGTAFTTNNQNGMGGIVSPQP